MTMTMLGVLHTLNVPLKKKERKKQKQKKKQNKTKTRKPTSGWVFKIVSGDDNLMSEILFEL